MSFCVNSIEIEPGSGLRVVGPGRRERGYQARIQRLEGEIECSALFERGSQRLLDRLEERLDAARSEQQAARQIERRLILALGAVQRENQILRRELSQAAAAPIGRLDGGSRSPTGLRGLLARIGGRRPGAGA